MKKNIKHWLSRNFRKSKCAEVLDGILEKDEILYSYIDWEDEDYYTKKNNTFIKYNIDEYNNVKIRISDPNRKIGIKITNEGNHIAIRDKKIYKEATIDEYRIVHNLDNISYFEHKNLSKYRNGELKVNYKRSMQIENANGKLINYYDSTEEKSEDKEEKKYNKVYHNNRKKYVKHHF